MPYHIRVMQPAEVTIAVDWAAAEGWNPGLHDAAAFLAADAQGFLLGELEGQPAATISAVRYGSAFAFIGCYIVAPAWRGRGYGMAVWREAMARLAGRTIGLDGVVAQQHNYRKSGFALAHRNVRYEGHGSSNSRPAPLVPLNNVPWSELLAYDTVHFGYARPDFLAAWRSLPDAAGWALVEANRIRGYGVVRRCRNGCKIGPLFAETESDAETLFAALAAFAPDKPLFLDVPEPNSAAVALARRASMNPVFETARMYAGPPPPLPLDRVFGITTFELG